MPVDSKSPYYVDLEEGWKMISDLQSEKKMKDATTTYVPQLTGQSDIEYEAYLKRGSLYGATTRTQKGLTGAIMRKPPEAECPEKVKRLFRDMTLDGKNFEEVVRKVVTEDISYGYYGILIDAPPEGGDPKLAMYSATSILYPVTERFGDKIKLMRLTLKESAFVPKDTDPYETEEVEMVRELRINEEGVYEQVLHKKVGSAWQAEPPIQPEVMGKKLTEIPFVFFGAQENSVNPKESPLLDLAYLNVKHFAVNVDYFHALHYCGLPTPWAVGFEMKEGETLKIGSSTAWVSGNENAKCGIMQATADSVGALENGLDKIEKQMAVVGSRMIEQQRRGVETAEGLLIRQTSDFAVLSNIASCVEEGMKEVLRWLARWVGVMEAEIEKIKVILNKDYTTADADPQVLTALFVALQNNTISLDTFLLYLKTKEVLPVNRTLQEEKDLILSGENRELVEKMFGSIKANDMTDNQLKGASSAITNGQEE
jgi:hypothetical protein